MLGQITSLPQNLKAGVLRLGGGELRNFQADAWLGKKPPVMKQAVKVTLTNGLVTKVKPQWRVARLFREISDDPELISYYYEVDRKKPHGYISLFFSFYFSSYGRVSLRQYWLYFALPLIFFIAVPYLVFHKYQYYLNNSSSISIIHMFTVMAFLYVSFMLCVTAIVTGKRWHDLDKRAFTGSLIDGLPLGRLAVIFHLLTTQGTDGANRYGLDPR